MRSFIDDILLEMDQEKREAFEARKSTTLQDDWYDAARIQGLPKEWAGCVIGIQRKMALEQPYEELYQKMKDIELLYFGEEQ